MPETDDTRPVPPGGEAPADPRFEAMGDRVWSLYIDVDRLDDQVQQLDPADRETFARLTTQLRGALDAVGEAVERRAAGL